MDAHTFGYNALEACLQTGMALKDPGTGKAIKVDKSFGVCPLTIAAAGETRTLPTASNDLKGCRVMVVANEITNSGTCTISGQIFNTEGQWVEFICVKYNSAFAWVASGNGGETMLEVARATDVSARSIAVGAAKTLTYNEHEGKTILLDTAANSILTMPTTTTVLGARFRIVVSVKSTGTGHTITLPSDSLYVGSISNHDRDGATASWFAANGTSNNVITLDGVTKGGQVGDWIDLECVVSASTSYWALMGQLSCPTGQNPATAFSG